MKQKLLCILFAVSLAGCGKSKPASIIDDSPLTVEQWKELPPETKYDPATFERLKLGEPKLQNDREWVKFNRDMLVPSRKKDLGK